MSRLLVSTFIRMLKKVIFWFFVLCMFAYGVYSALNIASEARIGFVLDGCLFECLPLMGLISAIFTSLFIGSEYSDGTIRNKIIVGHSRIRIYLANLIVCAIASVLISLSYTVGVFVIGNMNGGELITETATIFLCMISSLMISVTFASIMTLLAILNTNKAGNVVVSMILALVLLVSGSFIHQKLGEPKLYDNYVTVNEMGIPTQVEQLPNPQFVSMETTMKKTTSPIVREYKIGDITYIVKAVVKDGAKEDAVTKVRRLIQNDLRGKKVTNNFEPA